MTSYALLPNEVPLLREESAVHGRNSSCDLLLTNINLVITPKGMFGGSKPPQVLPLRQIKLYNGQPHARLGTARGSEVLEVYFQHGEEFFRFPGGGKRTIQTWAAKINEAVTGQPAAIPASAAAAGTEFVIGVLKDTMGAFRSLRSPKASAATPATAPSPIATRCESCGAPVDGMVGASFTCPYCNSVQTLRG